MISSTVVRGSDATVPAIAAASFSVGMIAATRGTCAQRLQRNPQPVHGRGGVSLSSAARKSW
jgi:hypothetical protein